MNESVISMGDLIREIQKIRNHFEDYSYEEIPRLVIALKIYKGLQKNIHAETWSLQLEKAGIEDARAVDNIRDLWFDEVGIYFDRVEDWNSAVAKLKKWISDAKKK